MTHRTLTLIALLAICSGAAGSLNAQVRFGAQGSWGDESDLGIGARLEYGLEKLFPNAPVRSAASFDYFFPGSDLTYWEINYNVFYQFNTEGLAPYAGGGLVLGYASFGGSSDTDMGLNLGGGLKFKTAGKLAPFVEGRIELGAAEQLVITGGLLF
jgi:hypothetical protein